MKDPVYPQPLLTRGQLFQIRAARSFDALRRANAAAQAAEKSVSAAVAAFYAVLPEGYRVLPYGGQFSDGEVQLYAIDALGNDVMFPCTAAEAWEACWTDSGQPKPLLEHFSPFAAAKEQLAEAQSAAALASAEISMIDATTPDPTKGNGTRK
jgi:hypothetical protein